MPMFDSVRLFILKTAVMTVFSSAMPFATDSCLRLPQSGLRRILANLRSVHSLLELTDR